MATDDNPIGGYECARTAYDNLSTPPQTSAEWVSFFHEVTSNCDELYEKSRAAAFITAMEVKSIDVGLLCKKISQIGKASKQYENDARVDNLLERPKNNKTTGPKVNIPVELRPNYNYNGSPCHCRGKLGSIYIKEVGMHMYLPYCDIYDSEDPDMLVCAGTQLDSTSTKVSELLTALQSILDPEHKDTELQQAITRCRSFESQPSSLPMILKANNIGIICLMYNSWRQINHQHIHQQAMYAELDDNDHIQVYLEPWSGGDEEESSFDATAAGFDLSDFFKEALNRARGF